MQHPPPLSPHLQVYRLPLTALLSITHRITGVLLCFGVAVWLVLLIALAWNDTAYAVLQQGLSSIAGRLLTGAFVFALFVHLTHGVRHLLWDIGLGLARDQLDRLARYEVLAALGQTLICVAYALL
jgi:succinate dehydrogenase / fumarate reductase cytochrome b subunit